MNRKHNVVFLILHYGEDELTYQAIESVLSLNHSEHATLVIVDNGIGFKNIYANNQTVHVVSSPNNLGFSRGNNLGYKYIKQNFDPEFLIVMNNDVLFQESDFIDELYSIYDRKKFYVCGPDIYVPYGKYHSSPLYDEPTTKEQIEKEIKEYEDYEEVLATRSAFRSLLGYALTNNQLFLRFNGNRKKKKTDANGWDTEQENVVLQGSFLVFDRRFISCNEKVFDPETFLYMEENILSLRCKRNGWNILYAPSLRVNHLVHGSSLPKKMSYKEYREKQLKSCKRQIETRKIYLSYYNTIDEKDTHVDIL